MNGTVNVFTEKQNTFVSTTCLQNTRSFLRMADLIFEATLFSMKNLVEEILKNK